MVLPRRFLAVAAVLAVLGVACSGDATETDNQGPASTPGSAYPGTSMPPANSRGGAAPFYQEPIPLVPGTYFSAAGTPEGLAKGMQALAAEEKQEKFEGYINGFRLFTYEHAIRDRSVDRKWCGGGQIVEFREVKVFEFGYLLPGTAANTPQFESICGDGSIANAGQRFSVGNMNLTVAYVPGELSLAHDASVDRVFETTVNGQPGVEIRPLTDDGFGRTWIAFAGGDGFIVLDATDMPLTDARKIAEGVKCVIC